MKNKARLNFFIIRLEYLRFLHFCGTSNNAEKCLIFLFPSLTKCCTQELHTNKKKQTATKNRNTFDQHKSNVKNDHATKKITLQSKVKHEKWNIVGSENDGKRNIENTEGKIVECYGNLYQKNINSLNYFYHVLSKIGKLIQKN